MTDREPAVQEKLAAIQEYTQVKGIPTLSLMKMAKLGVAIDRWMQDKQLTATAIQCWTSLEEFYGVGAVHDHEHDVQLADVQRVRDGHRRRRRHARAAGGVGPARGAARLEQQLRRGPGQGGRVPLLEPAQGVLRRAADGLPGDHRRHGRQREHVRHHRWPRETGPVHVLPRVNRRSEGRDHLVPSAKDSSPTTGSRRSAATASSRFRASRNCCARSAGAASSTTLRRPAQPLPEAVEDAMGRISGGTCTGTSRRKGERGQTRFLRFT